jgi:hypothetical protein
MSPPLAVVHCWEGRPGRERRGRICACRCSAAAAPRRPEAPHLAPPPTESRPSLLRFAPPAVDPAVDLAPAVETRGASSESRSPPAWGGARWSRVPPLSRLEVDDGEHRLCSVPTPPLPLLCSARRGQGASLRPPRSRGRGRMAHCSPSRRCCWPRIDPAAARPPGKERRWSRIGAGRLSRWRSCWPASCAEESRRGRESGAGGSEEGGQRSRWDAASPGLRDGEGLLHFAAADAAAAGAPTVAEAAAFWGCSMRCTCCWSQSYDISVEPFYIQ